MTDREAMIEAIRNNPRDMTPRLVFADWLDDYGEGDRDRATSEFIRLSCRAVKATYQQVMHRDAYPWLEGNWARLVPDLIRGQWWRPAFRSGRWIHGAVKEICEGEIVRRCARLEFWHGFVRIVAIDGYGKGGPFVSLLRRDQPLAVMQEWWFPGDPIDGLPSSLSSPCVRTWPLWGTSPEATAR